MDIFFSTGKALVRYATAREAGRRAAWRAMRNKDRNYAGHAGFITTQHGQLFISEMTPRGMRENPFEVYRGRKNRIIEVYHWSGFNYLDVRRKGEERMAWLRRKGRELKYDWWGAITSSWLGRKVFFWKRNDPERDFCSENVINVLSYCGHPGPFPEHQYPEEVRQWMRSRSEFERLSSWDIPIR
jgi:hypothetical protein